MEFDKNAEKAWNKFLSKQSLSEKQADQFKTYLLLLLQWSEKINLTAITDVPSIVSYHFADSLGIREFVDFKKINSICDVGTGAGFPAIPIKIAFPDLKIILIEVNHKKIRFLQEVVDQLGLDNVEICDLDWRTFLRKTSYDVDLFFARASLSPDELIRAFSPICFYKNATIIYWASVQWGPSKWGPSKKAEPFIKKQELYTVGNKKRKFVFLSAV